MKLKLQSALYIFGIVALLMIGAWLATRSLSLYYQVRGGRLLEQVLQTAIVEGQTSIPCTLNPVTDVTVRKQLEDAAQLLIRSSHFNPNDSQAYLLLGRTYCLLDDFDLAIKAYKQYTKLRPENALGHLELGFAYDGINVHSPAVHEWQASGVTIQDFMSANIQAIYAEQYSAARAWYRRITLLSEEKQDTFPDGVNNQPLVLESFINTDRWEPCSWCENTPGSYEVSKRVLEITYNNIPGKPSGFGIVSEHNLPVDQFHKLMLRLKGKPGTLLTIEIVQDGVRSRPINFQSVPEYWDIWTIPIGGSHLNEVLISIASPEPLPKSEVYQVLLDWIALK